MSSHCDKNAILKRLRRIEGQVRGVAKMVEDERYCIDILHQLQAIKAALARSESVILKNHSRTCIAAAIATHDEAEQRRKFDELIDLLEKFKA